MDPIRILTMQNPTASTPSPALRRAYKLGVRNATVLLARQLCMACDEHYGAQVPSFATAPYHDGDRWVHTVLEIVGMGEIPQVVECQATAIWTAAQAQKGEMT